MFVQKLRSEGTTNHPRCAATLTLSIPKPLLALGLFSCFSTPSFLTRAQAPSTFFIPITVSFASFSRAVTKLYVIGGAKPAGPSYTAIRQVISLDLTIPFNSTAPAWTQLANGPPQSLFPTALSSDEQTLFAFHILDTNSPWQYNVQENKWQESVAKFERAEFIGVGSVTDPRTGLIYLAGGFDEVNKNAPIMKTIDIFDPVSQTIHVDDLPDPTSVFPIRQNYANVWSKYKNSILYWGGNNKNPLGPGLVENSVAELSTDSMTWSTMETQGNAPAGRSGHCMAANEDGTKVVIYGGILTNETVVGDLWILDVVTSTWSQGIAGPERVYSICTVAGDQFLLWGGSTGQNLVSPPEMLMYNLNTSAYIQQYTPPAFYKDLKPPPRLIRTEAPWPINNPALKSRSATILVSVGCAVGGFVLITVFTAIFFIRRRRRQGNPYGGLPRSVARLLRRGRGSRGSGQGTKNDPQENPEDYALEFDLRRLEDKRNKLEDQKKELDQRRERLVLQHRQSTLKRGPTSPIDSRDVFVVPLSAPHQVIPDPITSNMYSAEDLESRRTVQGVFGPLDMLEGDSYAGHEPRRQGEIAQEMIEPTYEPSPMINSAIPDLVYLQAQDVGMDWTRQQQYNHPHASVEPTSLFKNNTVV